LFINSFFEIGKKIGEILHIGRTNLKRNTVWGSFFNLFGKVAADFAAGFRSAFPFPAAGCGLLPF